MDKEVKGIFKHAGKLHKLSESFFKHLQKKYYKLEHKINLNWQSSKRKYRTYDGTKVYGHGAMQHIEKFVNKHPGIKIAWCDDDVHATSRLVFIPHRTNKDWMGVTVLFVPQCTNIQNKFFLYPEHVNDLIKTLREIKKEQGKLKRI